MLLPGLLPVLSSGVHQPACPSPCPHPHSITRACIAQKDPNPSHSPAFSWVCIAQRDPDPPSLIFTGRCSLVPAPITNPSIAQGPPSSSLLCPVTQACIAHGPADTISLYSRNTEQLSWLLGNKSIPGLELSLGNLSEFSPSTYSAWYQGIPAGLGMKLKEYGIIECRVEEEMNKVPGVDAPHSPQGLAPVLGWAVLQRRLHLHWE